MSIDDLASHLVVSPGSPLITSDNPAFNNNHYWGASTTAWR
jgi:hypothetical protein